MLGFSPLALGVAVLAVIVVVSVLSHLLAPKPKADWMQCPYCQKTLQKGRRKCPFCNETIVKY